MVYIGWILIVIGIFFVLSGTLGLYRFPGFYNKLHAASVTECCGVPISLIGLSFIQSDWFVSIKLVIAALLILILNPVASFALGRASIDTKIDKDGRIR